MNKRRLGLIVFALAAITVGVFTLVITFGVTNRVYLFNPMDSVITEGLVTYDPNTNQFRVNVFDVEHVLDIPYLVGIWPGWNRTIEVYIDPTSMQNQQISVAIVADSYFGALNITDGQGNPIRFILPNGSTFVPRNLMGLVTPTINIPTVSDFFTETWNPYTDANGEEYHFYRVIGINTTLGLAYSVEYVVDADSNDPYIRYSMAAVMHVFDLNKQIATDIYGLANSTIIQSNIDPIVDFACDAALRISELLLNRGEIRVEYMPVIIVTEELVKKIGDYYIVDIYKMTDGPDKYGFYVLCPVGTTNITEIHLLFDAISGYGNQEGYIGAGAAIYALNAPIFDTTTTYTLPVDLNGLVLSQKATTSSNANPMPVFDIVVENLDPNTLKLNGTLLIQLR